MPDIQPIPSGPASAWVVLFVIAALSGLYLHRQGSPPKTLPLTLHKLSALAAGVLLGIAAWPHLAVLPAVYGGAAVFLAAIASGGMASAGVQPPQRARRLHRILAWLNLLAAALLTYALTA